MKFIFIFFIYYYNFKHYESVNLSLNQNKNQTISFSQDQNLRTIVIKTLTKSYKIQINQNKLVKKFLIWLFNTYNPKQNFSVVSIKRPFDGIVEIGMIDNITNISYNDVFLDQLYLIIKKARLEEYCLTLMDTEEIKQWKMTETLNSDFIARLYCLSRYISNNFNPRKSKDISFSKVPEIPPEQTLKFVIYFFEIIMNIQNRGYSEHYNNIIKDDPRISEEFFYWFIDLII